MRSRWLAVVVAFALVAAAGAGCSQQGSNQGGGGSNSGNQKIGSVTVIGVWGGTELDNFRKVVKGWEDQTGGTMKFEGTRDLSAILRARVSGGNAPDIAILPNPAMMKQFGAQMKPLDNAVDMTQLQQNYSQQWIEQGTVNGKLLGIVVKASPKSTVWYDPKRFQADGYQVPQTWDELMTLTDKMRSAGKIAPWAMGMEAGGASGWPGSDWIQEIYLGQNGPDKYDQWVQHKIPWTDPTVKQAFETFGKIATTDGNVPGGASAIASTNFQDASYLPFQNPPKAYMYFLGAFTQGFISGQFPDLKPAQDYDFFEFPKQNEAYKGATTVGGDTIVMFKDTASARSLVNYLAKGSSWEPWAKAGGFTTPNRSISASAYPDPLTQKAAKMLTESPNVRFDADDLMPSEVQTAEWKAILNYIQNPNQLDSILKDLESTAKDAYANQQQ